MIFLSEPLNTNTDNNLVSGMLNLGTLEEGQSADSVYFVGKNITDANIQGGGAGLSFLIPEDYYDGYKYFFIDHLEPFTHTAGDITLNIKGNNAEITKAYLLKKLFEFPDDDTFIRIDMSGPERGAIIHEDLYLDYSKIQGKIKRRVGYTAERQDRQQERLFEVFRETNTHFMFVEDFEFYPHRIYKAMLGREVNTRYSILNKLEGVDIDFDVLEL